MLSFIAKENVNAAILYKSLIDTQISHFYRTLN